MTVLRGKPVADRITEEAKAACARPGAVVPTLCVIRVGEKEEDLSYQRAIEKRFAAAGARVEAVILPEEAGENALIDLISEKNRDCLVHGIIVFFPLPASYSEEAVRTAIAPEKDVDGQTDAQVSAVFRGETDSFAPCTAEAVMKLLSFYEIPLKGKRVTVVGRSLVVGRPLSMLLLSKDATVTLCHSKTSALPEECRRADILISCAGRAGLITSDCLREGQILVDVGMNQTEKGLAGDVAYDDAERIADMATPVPGGVGPVTSAVLLAHTVKAAESQNR